MDKPDLAIYSQREQLAHGNQPTWDSPDIATNHWGPFRLMDEAEVFVANLSPTTPAVGALVHYSIAPFGIGMPETLLQTRVCTISPGERVELRFPLDRATLEGDPRIGVHIRIEHPHDANLENNLGSQVHDGSYTSEVGRTSAIPVPVRNASNFSNTIRLDVLPTPLDASIEPSVYAFAPQEQIVAKLRTAAPPGLTGQQSATVIGRLDSGGLIGGVTRLLRMDV